MWGVVVFLAVLSVGGAQNYVEQCQVSDGELPVLTHIEECFYPPCLLPQEQVAVINFVFVAPRNITDMRTSATAFLSDGPIVPLLLGDGAYTCNFLLDASCPVSEGQMLFNYLETYIEPFFAVGTEASVEFTITDENNKAVFCSRVRVRITPPVHSITGELKKNPY